MRALCVSVCACVHHVVCATFSIKTAKAVGNLSPLAKVDASEKSAQDKVPPLVIDAFVHTLILLIRNHNKPKPRL